MRQVVMFICITMIFSVKAAFAGKTGAKVPSVKNPGCSVHLIEEELAALVGFPKKEPMLLVKIPNELPFSGKEANSVELLDGGQIIPKGDNTTLKNLKPGIYCYVVFDDGSVGIIDRIANKNAKLADPNPKFLGTHRSILNLKTKQMGMRPRVFAAGEIEIGEVADPVTQKTHTVSRRITNESGSFLGGAEHLDYGAAVLEDKGLKITRKAPGATSGQETLLIDYTMPRAERNKKFGLDPHARAAGQAEYYLWLQETPERKAALEKMEKLWTYLSGKFPHPTRVGRFDRTGLRKVLDARGDKFPPGSVVYQKYLDLAGNLMNTEQDGVVEGAAKLFKMNPDNIDLLVDTLMSISADEFAKANPVIPK